MKTQELNLDRSSAKPLNNQTAVWSRYAIELGSGDWGTLMLAPDCKTDDEWIYLETNGNPCLIGWLDTDDNIAQNAVISFGVAEYLDDQPLIREAIEAFCVEVRIEGES